MKFKDILIYKKKTYKVYISTWCHYKWDTLAENSKNVQFVMLNTQGKDAEFVLFFATSHKRQIQHTVW